MPARYCRGFTPYHFRLESDKGFSLIDVVVGIALMLVLFMALFGVLKASLILSTLGRAKVGATAVAQTQMEYLRGLSYDSIGTVGGIPSGSVPQFSTTTENGIAYVAHTFINYIDDPSDGLDINDTNGIITDYKRAAVTVTYSLGGIVKTMNLVSNFAPPGLEVSAGGGTLIVKAVNAVGAAVTDAAVVITNSALTPPVHIDTFTNVDGTVNLPGAATSSSYQIAVSKSGYSSAQTYARDATNQNPNPGYLTVSRNQTTTSTFPIDFVASLTLSTFSPVATSTFSDTFTDNAELTVMSSTTVTNGALSLVSGETQGFARSIPVAPARLVSWGTLLASTNIPSGSSIVFHLYDGNGNLLPDDVLPGNTIGFDSLPISLMQISTTTYPSLAIGASLSAGEVGSPTILSWSLPYSTGPTPLPNISFTLTGAKTIGSTGSGNPLYKTVVSNSTGAGASIPLTLEWDTYTPAISGYDVVDACSAPPFVVAPGSSSSFSLFLSTASTNSLRVLVSDNTGKPVAETNVTLSRPGYSKTVPSSGCGNAYFGALATDNDYTVVISKTGYTTETFTNVSVSGASSYGASFP